MFRQDIFFFFFFARRSIPLLLLFVLESNQQQQKNKYNSRMNECVCILTLETTIFVVETEPGNEN